MKKALSLVTNLRKIAPQTFSVVSFFVLVEMKVPEVVASGLT